MPPSFLTVGNERIAYHHTPGAEPGVLFLGGFVSDMSGSKAVHLDAFCKAQGWQFTRMDYGGHGQSSGDFLEGSIGLWASHAQAVLDHVTTGPQIIVGSSMGGWIMLLLAQERPERIAGMVGVAAAPDFTEDLIWEQFTPEHRAEMEKTGHVVLPSCTPGKPGFTITKKLIEEGRDHLLLRQPRLETSCPLHLIQGMQDPDVPYNMALTIADKSTRDDVEITFIKNGDHRLSEPENLLLLENVVKRVRSRR